ncbi:MAG: hypothetical protein JWM20_792 [Patescibacteria group bacterium]|nr:hypothetical protein [Patescibacteria group bacterium]
MNTVRIDHEIIHFLRRAFIPFARFAVFAVYFWFGILKIIGLSPASSLVHDLFNASFIYVVPFHIFYILFACFEVLIGVMFLIPRLTRYVIPLLFIHMATTFLPLVLLPREAWNGFLVPTMEGQYILKNLVIIAVGIGIAAHVHPLPRRTSQK